MKLNIRPMTEQEAWNHVLDGRFFWFDHRQQMGYNRENLIPNDPHMRRLLETKDLSADEEAGIRKTFRKIYQQHFSKLESKAAELAAYSAGMQEIADFFAARGYAVPNELDVLITFGTGGSYSNSSNIVYLCATRRTADRNYQTMRHEFIHLLIEHPIIRKYNVPHILKEAVVDEISRLFGMRPEQFENNDTYKFAGNYINSDSIKTELDGAVKRMMNDYNAMLARERVAQNN